MVPKINYNGSKCRLVVAIVELSIVVKLVTFTTMYVGAKLTINSAVKCECYLSAEQANCRKDTSKKPVLAETAVQISHFRWLNL